MKKYLIIIFGLFASLLSFSEGHDNSVLNDCIIDADDFETKFPAASIHHKELSNFIFDKLIPEINNGNSSYGEIRLKMFFSKFSETSPISVDLKLMGNNRLRNLSFVNAAKKRRCLCKQRRYNHIDI